MEAITCCPRCPGMKEGWNRKYILHRLICLEVLARSVKSLIITVMFSSLIFAFPVPTGVFSEFDTTVRAGAPVVEATFSPAGDPAIFTIERLLTQHGVEVSECRRIADAIVGSSRKYHLDPKLVASIIIVESRANPFAISESSSVGIMQIHVPTWGRTADKQNINLFKVEDNVAFGVRILRGYVAQFGLWAGVMRYKGWTDGSDSQQKADEYVQKVKRIYQPQLASIPPAAIQE